MRTLTFVLALLLGSTTWCIAASNVYGLISQNELANRYADEIKPYWEKNVKESTFKSADGRLELRYASMEAPNARGIVVISNGRTETYLKYKELAFDLIRAGYTVYIPDHRGQGMSPRLLPDSSDHDKGYVDRFDDYVQDLHTFVRQVVQNEQPGKRLFLLGHSMGGGIATRYLQAYPDTFVAAALSSPMIKPNAKIFVSVESSCWWFKATSWLCPTCYAGFSRKPYELAPDKLTDYTHSTERWHEVLQVFAENDAAKLGAPTRRWASEACKASDLMLEQVATLRTPLLILQAGDDKAVMPDAQNAFCDKLKNTTGKTCNGPNGGPLVIEKAAHELFIEADQYRIPAVTAILDFFAKY